MLGLSKHVGACFLRTSTNEVDGDPLEHCQTEAYYGNVNPIVQFLVGFTLDEGGHHVLFSILVQCFPCIQN